MLYLNGIETSVADIDIVIDEKDIDKLDRLVSKFKHIEDSGRDSHNDYRIINNGSKNTRKDPYNNYDSRICDKFCMEIK